jgi:predicted RNA-binding protein associated with RNAse of E/G family
MITVVKQDPWGKAKTHYQGEIVEYLANGVVIQAFWTRPVRDLGYTIFEPGDLFIEYYYTDRWFNIFEIRNVQSERKGWYCNIAEPAIISADHIEQIDLYLDMWVTPTGEILVLDEDEFAAATTLSETQCNGARKGLQTLTRMVETRQEMFAVIA